MDYAFTGKENDLLVVIDVQEDFTYGPLGTTAAIAALYPMRNLINNFKGRVVYTQDTHFDDYLQTQEGKRLPVKHAIRETKGWRIEKTINTTATNGALIFRKSTFGSESLFQYIRLNTQYKRIFFVGYCTGICVISNVVMAKTANPEAEIRVIENLCACVNEKTHEAALTTLRTLQAEIDTYNYPKPEYEFHETDEMTYIFAKDVFMTEKDTIEIAQQYDIRLIDRERIPETAPERLKHGLWLDTYANNEKLKAYL